MKSAQQSLINAKNTNDTVYVNLLLAGIYADIGENETALTLYRRNLPMRNDYWNNRNYSNEYAELLIKTGNTSEALTILNKFDQDSIDDMLEVRRLKLKGKALMNVGNVGEAYRSISEALALEDSLWTDNGLLGIALREYEGALAQDRLDDAIAQANRWKLLTFIAVIIIGGILAGGALYRWLRSRKRRAVINKEEAPDTDESRQLMSATLQMSRMSEALSTIGELASSASPDALDKIASEIKSLDYSAHTWEIFRSSFERLHPGFFDALNKEVPNLSIGAQRMAAYIILGLTNKEIATLINRQPRTVETIKYRLRKDLHIPPEIPTVDYLRRFLPLRQ